MASQPKGLEGLDISPDEIKRLTNALKDEKFREMFVDYAKEISDPENRKRYEEEIAQLEKERGMNVQFVHPDPGYVLKTSVDGDKKAFINIAKNAHIEKPSSSKEVGANGRSGLQWSIPHSFAPPRDDVDNKGNKCKVYDVVFHPDTYRMAESNDRFRKMIEDTALDGIERQFDVKLDRHNIKRPKMKFKGMAQATVIRQKTDEFKKIEEIDDRFKANSYPYDDLDTNESMQKKEAEIKERELRKKEKAEKTHTKDEERGPNSPKFTITHSCEVDMQDFRNVPDAKTSIRPTKLIVAIDLPLLKSAASVSLDIFEKKLLLESVQPAAYKLDLKLPYPVKEESGAAKFDKNKRQLIVTLPVLSEKKTAMPSFIIDDTPSYEPLQNGEEKETRLPGDISTCKRAYGEIMADDMNIQTDQPLIEEISSKTLECNGAAVLDNLPKDIWTEQEVPPPAEPAIGYRYPSFTYHQDVETVTFIFNVRRVTKSSIIKTMLAPHLIQFTFTSVGSGGFPLPYSFLAKFPYHCKVDPELCKADVSDQNVVLVLGKSLSCKGIWEKFEVGLDERSLEEKFFPTDNQLVAELERLEEMPAETLTKEATLEMEVTEMNENKLAMKVKKKKKRCVSECSDDIEVVHQREVPKLHSILKQRSHTVSESSDDVSVTFSRENSVNGMSESPISESDENGETKNRKSVSFNDRIEQTLYKTNQSSKHVKETVKNKRKQARKREMKKAAKEDRRRRRTSTGSECSSGDDGQSCGVVVLGTEGKEPGNCNQTKSLPDDNEKNVINGEKDDDKSPSVPNVTKLVENLSITDTIAQRTDPIQEPLYSDKNGNILDVTLIEKLAPLKDIQEVLVEENQEKKAAEMVQVDGLKLEDIEYDEDDIVDNDAPSELMISEISEDGESEQKRKQQKSIERVLSWEERNEEMEHKTKCAFDFTNTVMFDLDDD